MPLPPMEGRKTPEDLSARRPAPWGGAAAAVYPHLLLFLREGPLGGVLMERMLMGGAFFGAVGAALAAGTVLGAKGGGGELGAGSSPERIEPPDP